MKNTIKGFFPKDENQKKELLAKIESRFNKINFNNIVGGDWTDKFAPFPDNTWTDIILPIKPKK